MAAIAQLASKLPNMAGMPDVSAVGGLAGIGSNLKGSVAGLMPKVTKNLDLSSFTAGLPSMPSMSAWQAKAAEMGDRLKDSMPDVNLLESLPNPNEADNLLAGLPSVGECGMELEDVTKVIEKPKLSKKLMDMGSGLMSNLKGMASPLLTGGGLAGALKGALPALPSLPGLPSFPSLGGIGLPSIPGLGGLPSLSSLASKIPSFAGGAISGLPSLGSLAGGLPSMSSLTGGLGSLTGGLGSLAGGTLPSLSSLNPLPSLSIDSLPSIGSKISTFKGLA